MCVKYEPQMFPLRKQEECMIKSIGEEDAGALIICHKETSKETNFLLRHPEEIDTCEEEERKLLRTILDSERDIMLGAYWHHELVGYASITCVKDCAKTRHRASFAIALKKKAWGIKIGSILMHECLNIAHSAGYEQIELAVDAENEKAIALYKKFGFIEYGKLEHVFRQKDGTYDREYLMVKYLQKDVDAQDIEHRMYEIAIDLIKQRYPKGWGGAAVVHTDKDHYFTSVALDTYNSSSTLCMETGAILEACKYNEKITHCLCVVRDDEYAPFKILTPCGICQERLRYWGSTVRVGATTPNQELRFVTLDVLQPYHWTNAYEKEELEHYQADS